MGFFSNPLKAVKGFGKSVANTTILGNPKKAISSTAHITLPYLPRARAEGRKIENSLFKRKPTLVGDDPSISDTPSNRLIKRLANSRFKRISKERVSNDQLEEDLKNKLYRDEMGLKGSNYPVYKGDNTAPMSPLTLKSRVLKEQFNSKDTPYSKKINTLLRREGTGFSPEQSKQLLGMLGRNGLSENLASERLQKQFGSNYGYEADREQRLKAKLGKDSDRAAETSGANFKRLNQELAEMEKQRNVEVAKTFHKAGEQKSLRRNALLQQLDEFGNQENALNNLKNKAQRDTFDEEYETPYRKIEVARRSLQNAGAEDDHPSKTRIRNTELQRIRNNYNAPHVNYPGKRVVDIQPETQESFNRALALNPKYKDSHHNDRKTIEKYAMSNNLPSQIFNSVPGAMEPFMKNLDYLSRQQLKKESKGIAGKHVRLGTFGSGAHKAETEKNIRDILRRVSQEREGILTGTTKTEADLAAKREQNSLTKHGILNNLGNQEFGNVLERNRDLNRLGWTKRSNKQAQENIALNDWYRQLQHDTGTVNTPGYGNSAKQYDTDLSSMFNNPQNYGENGNRSPSNRPLNSIGEMQKRMALTNGPQGNQMNLRRSQPYPILRDIFVTGLNKLGVTKRGNTEEPTRV
jgi:hypothetical protein